jgi:hypothetical protein
LAAQACGRCPGHRSGAGRIGRWGSGLEWPRACFAWTEARILARNVAVLAVDRFRRNQPTLQWYHVGCRWVEQDLPAEVSQMGCQLPDSGPPDVLYWVACSRKVADRPAPSYSGWSHVPTFQQRLSSLVRADGEDER